MSACVRMGGSGSGSGNGRRTRIRIRARARRRNRIGNQVGNKELRMVSSVLDPSIAFPPPPPPSDLQLANRAPHRASG
jgi:hypothetical protein